MGVYVKGMEMPKTCDDCFLPLRYCPHAMKPNGECPLIPVPPHGRMIDADAFLALVNDSKILSDFLKCIISPLIRGEPTVIEAEEVNK